MRGARYTAPMRRFLLLPVLLLLPVAASAHGGRPSFEAESGPYLIDIGYSATGFRPEEEVTFDFDLYQDVNGTQAFADFQLVRVEITRGEEMVHGEELANEESFIPTMTYTFAEEGDYTLAVAYVQSGSVIADAEFPVPVQENAGAAGRAANVMTYVIAAILAVFGVGVAVTSFLRSRKA